MTVKESSADDEEAEPRAPTPEEKLLSWRESVLEVAGYNRFQAVALAESPADLHLAVELLKRGCDPETAVDILL